MKSYILATLAILIFVASSAVAVAVTVSVPDNIPGILGQVATAPIEIDNVEGLYAFDFDVYYDTALLDLSSEDVRTGSLTSGWGLAVNVHEAEGYAEVACSGMTPPGLTGNSLLELDFHVIATPGTSPINVSGTLNESIVPDFDPGSIVTEVPEPSTFVILLGGLLLAVPASRRGRR